MHVKLAFDWRFVFPAVLVLVNVGAAVLYGTRGDYRRMVYWLASAVCIIAVSWEK